MFKRLTVLSFIFLISISLIVAPVFAKENNAQETAKEYEQYKKQIAAEVQKTQVQIRVVIPYRDGFDGPKYASGTMFAKTTLKSESFNGKVTDNVVYFIHSNPHIINDIEKVLEKYKEAGIRIYILGRNNSQIEAEIAAWNWAAAGLLLRLVVPQEQAEDFRFEVAKIAKKLPISKTEEKFSDNLLADIVYLGGYPRVELADSEGKVSKYVINESIDTGRYVFKLIKTMHIPATGLVGEGQSGGGIFMINEKTGKPEWVGTTTLGAPQLNYAISIDVTVGRFLKEVSELKGLVDFPRFELEPSIGTSKTIIYGDVSKKEKDTN